MNKCTSIWIISFLDGSKTFVKINYWALSKKPIDKHVSLYLFITLCYSYQHQEMIVRWGCCISSVFNVTNGVPQGRILSPQLFNVYTDGLNDVLNKSTIGGSLVVNI